MQRVCVKRFKNPAAGKVDTFVYLDNKEADRRLRGLRQSSDPGRRAVVAVGRRTRLAAWGGEISIVSVISVVIDIVIFIVVVTVILCWVVSSLVSCLLIIVAS